MTFVEHNNREKANKFAEYVTGKPLREYLANKVKQYCGKNISVFDGAAGSGQLEQFISMTDFHAVEIQQESCEALKTNFPNAVVNNQSFFTYQSDIQVDAIAMNPPYSLKLKDLPEEDQQAIKELYPWKKSGVVDDIFLLKSMNYTKRYGFYIMFHGIAYRQSEKNANISEFQLSQNLASKEMCRHNLVRSVGYLKSISYALGYDFDECFELAYNEIKDRKGRWIDGSFVKEEDLG